MRQIKLPPDEVVFPVVVFLGSIVESQEVKCIETKFCFDRLSFDDFLVDTFGFKDGDVLSELTYWDGLNGAYLVDRLTLFWFYSWSDLQPYRMRT